MPLAGTSKGEGTWTRPSGRDLWSRTVTLRRGLLLAAFFAVLCGFAPHGAAAYTDAVAGTCPSGNAAIVNPTLSVVQGGTATATFKIAQHLLERPGESCEL